MFGQTKQIAEGFYNDLMKRENALHDSRMEICKGCPLFSNAFTGPRCDNNKTAEKDGNIIKGCGCFLDKKTRVPGAKCVLGKW